jgi:FlaG/FlaF family flagellin (archaellin)
MVAITVILAAVVATYVFGMAASIPKAKILTATVTLVDAKSVIVTYNGGQDQESCVGVRWDIYDTQGTVLTAIMFGTTGASASSLSVGRTKTISTSHSGRKHIVATAYFTDNTQQVILDAFY